ncbi:MAG: hypothetical protein QME96_06580 [Myxococcota bacterium]|nr:hypothetical protein [Myxococcota bacterium]
MATDPASFRDWIASECKRLGYAWFTSGDLNLNVVAVRNLPGRPNEFDDLLTCSYRAGGVWVVRAWPCTTDPGLYWLRNPGRTAGTAILKPGQYRGSHVVGRHKGAYPALVQDRPVAVYRDANRDEKPDYTGVPVETGMFGINVHASDDDPFDTADRGAGRPVEKWSAGCVVFATSAEYREWWSLVTQAACIYGPRFSLTLLERNAPVDAV